MRERMLANVKIIAAGMLLLCGVFMLHASTLIVYDDMILKDGFESYICEAKDECFYAAPGASESAACSFGDPCDLQVAKSRLSGGDYLYLLGGNYDETYLFTEGAYGDYELILAFGRNFNFQSPPPDQLNRVTIKAYPEHDVILDGHYDIDSNTGAKCFYTDQSYMTFSDFTFQDCKTGVTIGENRITADVTAVVVENNQFAGIHFVNDNGGNITIYSDAIGTIIQNNRLDGPGDDVGSMNSAGIYYTHDRHIRILHNEIYNHRTGIHYKHDHSPSIGNTGSVIAYNYLHDLSIAGRLNTRYTSIHNNISSASAGSFTLNHCSGVSGEGGDYNIISNNYFHDLGFNGCSDGLVDQGAYQNTVKNNIIATRFYLHPWRHTAHDSTMDHNLYMADIFENNVPYNLSQWQVYYGEDTNSLSGTPTFTSPDLLTVADYLLIPGSLGYQADENGLDMGPDVRHVGVQAQQ